MYRKVVCAMAEKKKNIHQDHRKRMRASYAKTGIDVMDDHKIIELLLFYGIPYKDTNPIAHELIEKYGDLNGVLNASPIDLVKVNGIGENAALLIQLVHDIAIRYRDNNVYKKVNLASMDRLLSFVSLKYFAETREIVYMISLDAHGRLKHCIKVADGTPLNVVADNRTLLELALRYDVTNVVMAHNHPDGFATPSQADIKSTQAMATLFKTIDVNFIDHIIAADNKTFSFAMDSRYLQYLG